MIAAADKALVAEIDRHAQPLGSELHELDAIVTAARGKRYVMLGEATHGTREFYQVRADITERLLTDAGFDAIAIEADWPDAYRVNRYVRHHGRDSDAEDALGDFVRFPRWMWRNTEVLRFVAWLHAFNAQRESEGGWPRVGFYGLDLYSLNASVHAVIGYLERVDPVAAKRARIRYGCLWDFIDDPQSYGYAMRSGRVDSCEAAVVLQLGELLDSAQRYVSESGYAADDAYFCAVQNAKVVQGAEEYYRALYRGRPNTWNLRDRHMYDTLGALSAHLGKRLGRPARLVVWAHNSHVGNAAATDMGERGETNIGQLAREQHGDDVLLVGFSTARGHVTAASDWDEPAETKRVRDPLAGSYEDIFRKVEHRDFLLDLRRSNEAVDLLMEPRLQRAIGVIYRPGTERHSHYFQSCLPRQFDFLLHFDATEALSALDTTLQPRFGELNETYPRGL